MSDTLAPVLMTEFAKATGIVGTASPRRYLWTDAFAVCNFLGLYRQTGRHEFLDLAVKLVDQVHHVLGRHRNDDPRQGWISGLSEQEGELHPTCGGLRIGKTLNERPRDQPLEQRLEWDRDGQYFHYLTKWMHALHRLGRETGEIRYELWATELAAVAQRAFTCQSFPGGPKRMVWKMSIDLTRPLVSSMGQHDPLDGLITCLELQAGVEKAHDLDLRPAVATLTELCTGRNWLTDDPLGIGGLLDDASRLAQIIFNRGVKRRPLLRQILIDAEMSLSTIARSSLLMDPADGRLAFRELGLSIGLHGMECIKRTVTQDEELTAIVSRLLTYQSVGEQIENFWSNPAHRRSGTWTDHHDINTVMLATSLVPEGYLQI